MIKITLPGEPISKDRPRFSKFGTYDPQKAQQNACKWQILDQLKNYPNLPFPDHVPIEIDMTFYFSIPNGKENLFHWGLLEHTSKPDYDNCEKFTLDVLSKIVYSDDRQVSLSHSRKEYSENPRTEIHIMPKKPICSDQVKEVLSLIPPSSFGEIGESLSLISDWCTKNENPYHCNENSTIDHEEVAYLILELAEKHADTLKKLNKKFPGLAKVLKEKMENK